MKGMTGVATLPIQRWIPLDRALSWMCFDVGADLGQLLDGDNPALYSSEDEIREEFQKAWTELADEAAKSGFEIRGRRERARQREEYWTRLSGDDLFNCRFLDIVLYPEGRTILVSRHDRDHDSVWDGMGNQAGWDYTDLLVRRDDVLAIKPRVRPKQARRKTSRLTIRAAVEHAKECVAGLRQDEVRREEFLAQISERYGLSRDAARGVWKEATADRPELRQRGRRKRAESN